MRRTVALMVLALLVGAARVPAEVGGANSTSVTSTATTVTLSTPSSEVLLVNDVTSANEFYARLFACGDTAAAATTSSPIRLEPGESVSLTHNPRNQRGTGWCGYSLVTAAAETATARVVTQ